MIKNVEVIKEKARKQLKEELDFCGCYRWTDEGIDAWLDAWEKGCEDQIVNIAEKSPYYDGDAKIVFPAEYPRDINHWAIREFAKWLEDRAKEKAQPARVNGLSYQQADKLCRLGNTFCNINDNYSTSMFDDYPNAMQEFRNILKCTLTYDGEIAQVIRKARDAMNTFREESLEAIGREVYFTRELHESGALHAMRMANLLNNDRYATQFLNSEMVSEFKYYFNECRFQSGQKLSRAVGNVAKKYGFNQWENWEKEYSKFADAVNPLMATKWTIISWNPVDYFTFCYGNSWSSCSNPDIDNHRGVKIAKSRSSITDYVNEDYVFSGGHASASLSYMFDKTSFIFYTVSSHYDGKEYQLQDKESRIVFSLSEDKTTLLQSRLYPQCNDDNPDDINYRIPREIVQKVICDALATPNLWTVRKGKRACITYANSIGVHYPDYTDNRNKQCNISYRDGNPSVIQIGANAICPSCGCVHDRTASFNCWECDPRA